MPKRLVYLGTAAVSLQMLVGRFLKAAQAIGIEPLFYVDSVGLYDEEDVARVGSAARAAEALKAIPPEPRPRVTTVVENLLAGDAAGR